MKIAVIGAGLMGSGIAQSSAASGHTVMLFDAKSGATPKALSQIDAQLTKLVEKGKIEVARKAEILDNVGAAHSLTDLRNADLAIEAIIENLSAKQALFKDLEGIVSPTALIASNTSSISITALAGALQKPERCIGIHFFNPVPLMELVEIIPGLQTSASTKKAANDFVTSLKKVAVDAPDTPGFIVNRILVPMINEAIILCEQGAEPTTIDLAMKLGTNQPMGPLALADFVGLDTLLHILEVLHRELGEDKYRPTPLLRKYVAAGWLGKKSGRGFYNYV